MIVVQTSKPKVRGCPYKGHPNRFALWTSGSQEPVSQFIELLLVHVKIFDKHHINVNNVCRRYYI